MDQRRMGGNRVTRLTSNIYHMANGDAPKGQEARQRNRNACAEAWHRHGLAVLDPDTVLDDWIRQVIINEATRQYGERGKT